MPLATVRLVRRVADSCAPNRSRARTWLSSLNMKVFVRYVFTGAVLVVVLDAIYAALSLYSHIAYAWFTLPQMAFYAILAWIVTRNLANWRAGAATAFIVSIVEATLGWWFRRLLDLADHRSMGPSCLLAVRFLRLPVFNRWSYLGGFNRASYVVAPANTQSARPSQ